MPRKPTHAVHVGVAEIAAVCNVKRKTAVQWRQRNILPAPCGCKISANDAWLLTDIVAWATNPAPRPSTRTVRDDVVKRLEAGEPIDAFISEIEARHA